MRLFHAIAAVVAAFALVLSPGAAVAALPQPAVANIDAPSVGHLVDVAESYWGPSVCAGRTQVHAVTTAETVAVVGDSTAVAFSPGVGSAFWARPACDVWIAADAFAPWSVGTLCHVIVHELGHDLGYRHTDDPTNVMYAFVGTPGPPVCDAAQARMTPAASPPAPTDAPIAIDAFLDDVDETHRAGATRWPTPRILKVGRDEHGRVAVRLANPASPRLTVRFYRGSDLGGALVKTVVARMNHHAFENAAATAVIVAPARWDAIDVQMTGGRLRAGFARWVPAGAVHDWPGVRGPVSGQAAPSAKAEFGSDHNTRRAASPRRRCGAAGRAVRSARRGRRQGIAAHKLL